MRILTALPVRVYARSIRCKQIAFSVEIERHNSQNVKLAEKEEEGAIIENLNKNISVFTFKMDRENRKRKATENIKFEDPSLFSSPEGELSPNMIYDAFENEEKIILEATHTSSESENISTGSSPGGNHTNEHHSDVRQIQSDEVIRNVALQSNIVCNFLIPFQGASTVYITEPVSISGENHTTHHSSRNKDTAAADSTDDDLGSPSKFKVIWYFTR